MSQYLSEAFKKLDLLNEDIFSTDENGLKELTKFTEEDENTNIIDIIDAEAETEEELEDSYVGQVILSCCVCQSKVYKKKEDVIIKDDVANEGEECPLCYSVDGFKVIGQVAPFNDEDNSEENNSVDKDETNETEETTNTDTELSEAVAMAERPGTIAKLLNDNMDELCSITYKPALIAKTIELVDASDVPENQKISFKTKLIGNRNPLSVISAYITGMALGEELEEAAFSGGYAGDNSINGGKVGGMGGSIHSGMHGNYLDRLSSKNPDIVEIITIKGKDIKPGMFTQAGEVKEAAVRKDNKGETKVYIMYTNNYDGFWEVDEDLEVMADPNDKSKPYIGTYSDFRKMGLKESKSIDESVNNVNVETDEDVINVATDENGKVTVTTEPIAAEATESGETIQPIETEVQNEIEDNVASGDEIEIDLDEFDESFDKLAENYLKKVYENINTYKTSKVAMKNNTLMVEGVIKFKSGKDKKTNFVFESKIATKTGKVKFIGENTQITRGRKAFTITGSVNNKKFLSESLTYNYGAKTPDGKTKRLYGTIKG